MNNLRLFRNAVFACVATSSLAGCLVDSVEPWLESDTVMSPELDFEGDWEVIDDATEYKYSVTLRKNKSSRSIDKQEYYIKILPRNYDVQFNFIGVVHKVNGIKLLQITNFSHFHYEVFKLANRPVVSLWQIAYDEDNIILWAPGSLLQGVATLKTMQDSDDKLLFIDSTENLQAYVKNWTENYSETKDAVKHILPIALTRAGTEFRLPDEMRELVPSVYEEHIEAGQN